MEDWEDEAVAGFLNKKILPKSNWDDEDLDEEDVKDCWEDEVDNEPPKEPKAQPPPPPAKSDVEQVKEASIAEKLGLVEEAATAELFCRKGDEKTLDNFIPKTEGDFAEYAKLISHKLRAYDKSYHYIGLLKAVMRLSSTSLKGTDAKDIASSVAAIANEKIKAEKEAYTKKKTAGKKKKLHIGKPEDDVVVSTVDDYDDDHFM